MTQLYVDMDGVLADFDTGYKQAFGLDSSKELDNVDWAAVRVLAGFYRNLPPMPDMRELWEYVWRHDPVVLTGIPKSVEEAAENKRSWVRAVLGPDVPVICCLSAEKYRHCKPGDVLIDDWEKYRDRWIRAGGRWITHTSAADSIRQLKELGL